MTVNACTSGCFRSSDWWWNIAAQGWLAAIIGGFFTVAALTWTLRHERRQAALAPVLDAAARVQVGVMRTTSALNTLTREVALHPDQESDEANAMMDRMAESSSRTVEAALECTARASQYWPGLRDRMLAASDGVEAAAEAFALEQLAEGLQRLIDSYDVLGQLASAFIMEPSKFVTAVPPSGAQPSPAPSR